jgi:hypothetical protein
MERHDDEPRFERETDARRDEGARAHDATVVERDDSGAVATDATTAAASPGTADIPDERAEDGSLLPAGEQSDLHGRWEEIQTHFVDDPRRAVKDADELVAGVMARMAERFARARDDLEGQWSRGEDVGTEELRVALQSYRAFFRRLLSA